MCGMSSRSYSRKSECLPHATEWVRSDSYCGELCFSGKVSKDLLLLPHLGYGDFAGLGNFNNFESSVDHQQPPHITMDEGATPQPLSSNGRRSGNSAYSLQQVIGMKFAYRFSPINSKNSPVTHWCLLRGLIMACGQMCYMKASQLQEIIWIKQDSAQIRNAVVLLEKEKDNLRQAVRKLKVWFNIFSVLFISSQTQFTVLYEWAEIEDFRF